MKTIMKGPFHCAPKACMQYDCQHDYFAKRPSRFPTRPKTPKKISQALSMHRTTVLSYRKERARLMTRVSRKDTSMPPAIPKDKPLMPNTSPTIRCSTSQ